LAVADQLENAALARAQRAAIVDVGVVAGSGMCSSRQRPARPST
jgi:hypothetical protein